MEMFKIQVHFAILCIFCALNVSASAEEPLVYQFFRVLHSLTPKGFNNDEDFGNLVQLKNKYLESYKSEETRGSYNPDEFSYFKIFPKFIATLSPNREVDFESCFRSAKVNNNLQQDNSTLITISLDDPDGLLCHVSIIVSTATQIQIKEYWTSGEHVLSFDAPTTDAETWDIIERGPRIFVYPISPETITYNLAATLALFEPVLSQGVVEMFAELNRDFLRAYVGLEMEPRDVNGESSQSILNEVRENVKNGDTFNIMRLDGLDPMIAWAMGASTGHTAVALWKDGELYICESNAKSPYWPVNGVQCNTFSDWATFALLADYNYVWVPLNETLSQSMDMEKAWNFVDSMKGIDYGYEVVLTGLIDTLYDNLPCAGSDNTFCLEPEHFEMLFSYTERISKDVTRVFKPAIMQRAGVPFDRPLVEAYHAAHLAGLKETEIAMIPEQDGWLYPTTRDGDPEDSPVMICNVFVCNVWKSAGVFSEIEDDIQCGETSVNDNYKLNIYNNAPPADVCQQADPENPLCQVSGNYKLRLDSRPGVPPRYNYVPMKPGLLETCPSKAPDYIASPDC